MAGIGKKICWGGGGGGWGGGVRVCKKEKLVQFAILKTRGKQISQRLLGSLLRTRRSAIGQQVFAKVNSAQFPYFSKVARSGVA